MPGAIYLDHHATTPPDPRVLKRMVTVAREHFGNPASEGHPFGWAAAKIVEEAREEAARLIGAEAREVVFTSGATEACNLALRGLCERYDRPEHLVTTDLEHPAVREPLAWLEGRGWKVTRVPGGSRGVVDPDQMAEAITDRTVLVAVIAAQNEIGTLQPLHGIGEVCRQRGVPLLTDAAQALGKIPLDVGNQGIALLAASAHKLYGPKGTGLLYVRRRDPRVVLAPQILGGGQERGLRSGTVNVPGIAAFGEACRLAREEMGEEARRLASLRDRLWERLRQGVPDVLLNGDPVRRLPGNLHVSFPGLPTGRLLPALTDIGVSAGSACSSGDPAAASVLTVALGVPPELARSSLRIGLGRFTTEAEVDRAAVRILTEVGRLRAEAVG